MSLAPHTEAASQQPKQLSFKALAEELWLATVSYRHATERQLATTPNRHDYLVRLRARRSAHQRLSAAERSMRDWLLGRGKDETDVANIICLIKRDAIRDHPDMHEVQAS